MSPEDVPIIEEARSFLDELFGTGVPLRNLLNGGVLPDGWSDRYLSFVDRASRQFVDSEPLPREVVAVIYNASVYCTKRYHDWQRWSGGANEATEAAVDRIRWAGDTFFLSRYWNSHSRIA